MRYPPLLWNNPGFISWDIVDNNGQPVIGATVTATLYVNRSSDTPDTIPGTPVSTMQNMVLVDQGNGNYYLAVPADAIPAIGDNYVLVIDAVMSGAEIGHWEADTSVVRDAPRVPNLTELSNVKDYLQILPTDTSQDVTLQRWIQSCSADFLNRIKRPGLLPPVDYNEAFQLTNWKSEDREIPVFLKNWPVNRVTSVSVNDTAIPVWDPTNPSQMGYVFDPTLPDEERQSITLLGYFWPIIQSWYTPYRSSYRPRPLRIQVAYNAGYNYVPYDIEEAVIEWVAFKKGLRQLQEKDQTEEWVQLGQYQQHNSIAANAMKMSGLDMPESVATVIQVYERPIVP
jgi:hypothetical protein